MRADPSNRESLAWLQKTKNQVCVCVREDEAPSDGPVSRRVQDCRLTFDHVRCHGTEIDSFKDVLQIKIGFVDRSGADVLARSVRDFGKVVGQCYDWHAIHPDENK